MMKVPENKQQLPLPHLLSLLCLLFCLGLPVYAQSWYDDARNLVSRTQEDLRHAEDFTKGKKDERERIGNAQKHLSEFDRALSRNKFDKGKLDEAIEDIKDVIDHNTLAVEDRDALTRDIESLRRMRATRGK